MAIPSLTLTASSRLSQDLMQTNGVSLRPTNQQETNTVATYTDPSGNAAALVILSDKNLYALSRDTTSDSGWSFQPVAQDYTDIVEIVCGLDSLTGQIHALFTTSGATYWMTQNVGTWGSPQILTGISGACSNLSVTYTAASSRMIVFAVASNGELVRATVQQPGGWTASSVDLPGGLLSQLVAPPLVTYLSEDVWLLAFCINGQLVTYEGQGTATTSQASKISLPNGASASQAILAFPGSSGDGSICVLATDENGQLYSSGYSAAAATTPIALGNSTKIVNASGWADATGNFVLLASDFTGMLWRIKQTGWSDDGNATWMPSLPISPLVASVSFDTASALAQAPDQVFLQGYDFSLRFIKFDSNGGNWRPFEVRQPSGSAFSSIVTYQVRINLTDMNFMPQSNASIQVTSSKPVFFWCTQGMFLTGPDMDDAVSLTTDAMGGLSLSIPAFSPNMPPLTIWSGGTQVGTVQPDSQIHNYLAGQTQETYLPAQFNGSALSSAMTHNIDGSWNTASPVAPGAASNQKLAATVAGTMSGCSAATLGLIQNSNLGSFDVLGGQGGWVVDLSNLDQGFQSFTDQASFDAAYQQVFGASPAAALSVEPVSDSIFSDIGDVLDALWNGALTLHKIAWDIGTRALTLIAEIALDQIEFDLQLITAVITDPADIGAVFHSLIKKVEGQIGDFLDWLTSYLPFGDFKIAQQTIAAMLTTLPTTMSNQLSTMKNEFGSWISTNEATLNQALSDLKARYQGITIMQAFKNLTATPSLLINGSGGLGVPRNLSTKSYWFFSKLITCDATPNGDWPDYSSTQSFDSLTAQLDSPSADLLALLNNIGDMMKNIGATCTDIVNAESTPAGQLLTNIDDILDSGLNVLQDIGDLMFDAGSEGWGCFGQLMQQPLLDDLGVLGTLIQDIVDIAGEGVDPSAATILSWTVAVPIVLFSWDLGYSDIWANQQASGVEAHTQDALFYRVKFGKGLGLAMLILLTLASIVTTCFSDLFVSGSSGQEGIALLISTLANTLYAASLGFALPEALTSIWTTLSWALDCFIVGVNFIFIYQAYRGTRKTAMLNYATENSSRTLTSIVPSEMVGTLIVSAVGFLQLFLGFAEKVNNKNADYAVIYLPLCINGLEFLAAVDGWPLGLKEVANIGTFLGFLIEEIPHL